MIPASIPYKDAIVIEEDPITINPQDPNEVLFIEDGPNKGTVINSLLNRKIDKNRPKPMDTIISNSDTDEMDEFNTSTEDMESDQEEEIIQV